MTCSWLNKSNEQCVKWIVKQKSFNSEYLHHATIYEMFCDYVGKEA